MKERSKYITNNLSEDWKIIDKELEDLWLKTISETVTIN
jgi:hypothetical protein